MITPQQFIQLLPLAVKWAEQQEAHILKNGVPLTAAQINDARLVSVVNPQKVRLLKVSQIPLPDEPLLKNAAQSVSLITPNTIGLTLQYGILVRSDFWGDRRLIVHELVHVAQYEKLGGFSGFLNQYLQECIKFGYPQAPMEQEAINLSKGAVIG